MPRRVHLIVDTGVDDALAIVVAWLHPHLRLTGVTAAAGNVSLAQSVANTRLVLDVIGAAGVPLSAGASRRSDGVPFQHRDVHGPDGLAGLAGVTGSGSGEVGENLGSVDVLGDATVVCLAPMTTLLGMAPREVTVTYGRPGEANYVMDPMAAAAVRSAWSVRDVTAQATLEGWRTVGGGSGVAGLVDSLVAHQRRRGVGLADAAALLCLVGSRDPVADLARLLRR